MGTDVVTLTVIIQIFLICTLIDFRVSLDLVSYAPTNNSDPASPWSFVSGVMVPNGHSICPVLPFELSLIRGSPKQCHLGHSPLQFLVNQPTLLSRGISEESMKGWASRETWVKNTMQSSGLSSLLRQLSLLTSWVPCARLLPLSGWMFQVPLSSYPEVSAGQTSTLWHCIGNSRHVSISPTLKLW